MIKLLTIIGARPQIIKAAALSRAINTKFSHTVQEKILHTGQHYDDNMSAVFFEELGIPRPDFNLGVGSATHGVQTARMIEGIEKVLMGEKFDGVVIYGDTNSTLAGAIAASKLHIPVFHIEAGLRSFNMAMPEEINRIVSDHVSSILFAPTQTAVLNLEREGKGKLVCNCGDVMYDNSIYFASVSEKKSTIFKDLGISPSKYILATVHRAENTDNPACLGGIFSAIVHIAEEDNIDVVIPLHPRTRATMDKNLDSSLLGLIKNSERIRLVYPVTFLDMIALEKNSAIIMTDSGGVQKEAFFHAKPCVILRSETEWVEIVRQGAAIIAGSSFERIVEAYGALKGRKTVFAPLFGDGHASEKIVEKIIDYLR
jgi:UDP-GlcNAc3NAcA epimerase